MRIRNAVVVESVKSVPSILHRYLHLGRDILTTQDDKDSLKSRAAFLLVPPGIFMVKWYIGVSGTFRKFK